MRTHRQHDTVSIGLALLVVAIVWAGRLCAGTAVPQDNLSFSLNVHDFGYPDLSAATVNRVIDIHESLAVPVDIFLTTTMVDLFADDYPTLMERLRTSPEVAVSYHVRPPKPYYTGYDWMDLRSLAGDQVYAIVMDYETHGLDLATGRPTTLPGGFAKLASLIGRPPYIVGALADAPLVTPVDRVFADLGATMRVVHNRVVNAGESRDGLYSRPEHVDLKLYEHAGEQPSAVLEAALAQAHAAQGALAPYFVGVKMHDNDFFATRCAWGVIYMGSDRTPPWDVTYRASLKSKATQAALWTLYEGTVSYAASIRSRVNCLNAPGILATIESNREN